jgi:hypothetical protein
MPTIEVPPPQVDPPSGWRTASTEVLTPFDVGLVSVRAHTVVLEDEALAEAVRDRTGVEATWRFFFASRLRIRPKTSQSKALTNLVTERANRGFVDQLRDKGFEGVESAESRRFAVRDSDATLTRYRAEVPAADRRVGVEGYLAVWPEDDEFLLAGGAYPRSVPDGEHAAELRACFDPEQFRDELFDLVRSTR